MKGFKSELIGVGIFLLLIFSVGGFAALFQGLDVIAETIKLFFPIVKPIAKYAIKDYLTSPQFIFSIIVFALFTTGVVLSAKHKKILLLFITIIVDLISIISISMNLAVC